LQDASSLDPREVEKPFHWRWLRTAFQLLLRAPLRFGALIALLAYGDTAATRYLHDSSIPQIGLDRLGLLFLPLLWTLVSAIARGADDPRQTGSALLGLLRHYVWYRALLPGAVMVGVRWALKPAHPADLAHLDSGVLLGSFAAQCFIAWLVLELFYFPLLLFLPELSSWQLWRLASKADRINRTWLVCVLLGLLLIACKLLDYVISYGIPEATWLVFAGIVSYVAYRDVFERRPENLPKAAAVPSAGEVMAGATSVSRAAEIYR
jgi:hypothetical protein